jgi:predicted amidohydrolase
VGYVFPDWEISFQKLGGMYGLGFLIFAVTTFILGFSNIKRVLREWIIVGLISIVGLGFFTQLSAALQYKRVVKIDLAGIQMEFPSSGVLTKALDKALAKNTNAAIFVMSEYTLDGGVPDSVKNWCRAHERFLVIGGKEFVTNDLYYNTAFVVGTNGNIVFQQAKSVPIQFFKDGLPATNQALWNSPWGRIGLCICYDLSYTRVTDELVRQGAQLLIVPTMDVEEWGRHQHELHSRVAPVRAAEYGIPIFRVASSGISQAINGSGQVVAQTTIPGSGDILAAQLRLPRQGSLPMDRWLAPLCTGITGLLTAALLWLNWRDKIRAPKPQIPTAPRSSGVASPFQL